MALGRAESLTLRRFDAHAGALPRAMKAELLSDMYYATLSACPLFHSEHDVSLIAAACQFLRREVWQRGDVLIKAGAVRCDVLLFLAEGQVTIVLPDEPADEGTGGAMSLADAGSPDLLRRCSSMQGGTRRSSLGGSSIQSYDSAAEDDPSFKDDASKVSSKESGEMHVQELDEARGHQTPPRPHRPAHARRAPRARRSPHRSSCPDRRMAHASCAPHHTSPDDRAQHRVPTLPRARSRGLRLPRRPTEVPPARTRCGPSAATTRTRWRSRARRWARCPSSLPSRSRLSWWPRARSRASACARSTSRR